MPWSMSVENTIFDPKCMHMQVFKFGGATIKDAQAVERIGVILQKFHEPLISNIHLK